MTLQDVKDITKLIDDAQKVFESTATWKMKYDLIFGMNIWKTIQAAGFHFDWYDPDMDYDDDVIAYMDALRDFKKSMGNLNDL